MKSLILIFGFLLIGTGLMLCQPETAFGQDKTSAKTEPPVIIGVIKQPRTKRKNKSRKFVNSYNKAGKKSKKATSRRKVDMSKVPRVIRVIN
jgi:hypothetical protein